MTGLGIIDTDLCMWAGTVTPEMMTQADLVIGHPVLKAKPAPVTREVQEIEMLDGFNCWVERHPILAGLAVAGGYLLLRRRK